MRTSATGSDPRSAGFTLVELMVSLVIMALVSAVVVLTLPDGADRSHEAAETFIADLRFAARDSVIAGAATGVAITQEGYSVLRFRRGAWRQFSGEDRFAGRMWPDGVQPILRRDGEVVAPGEEPQIRFDSVGMATPFEIDLVGPDGRRRVVGTLTGKILLEEPDAETF